MADKKMIVVDLDGTLVTGFSNYDRKSLNLLKNLALKHYVIIATGRPFRSSEFYYKYLELNTPIINYNGAYVHHPKDFNFKSVSKTISKEHVFQIIEDNLESLRNVFCEVKDDIFLWKYDLEIKHYLHLEGGSLTIGNFKDILFENPNGVIVFVKEGYQHQLENYIDNKFKGKLKSRFWKIEEDFIVFEVYSPTTNKGEGVKLVAEFYNINSDDILAIGDGHNDIEMLNIAKVKVAMEDSHPELKAIANFHTTSVEKNGVYRFLKKYFK
ncbi:MAG: HAD family hydrolase [Bacilli bacterium]